jgi:hemerythrin-like domain-containing protein
LDRKAAPWRWPGEDSMRAIDELTRDHQRIKTVIARLEHAVAGFARARGTDVRGVQAIVGLCERWVERAHVLKEEHAFFPLLEARGLGPEITVVSALLAQHRTGEAFLRELRLALDRVAAGVPDARRDVVIWARDYIELLREHMRIEDQYFYALADHALGPGDDESLLEEFRRIDKAVGGNAAARDEWDEIPPSAPGTGSVH